MKTDFDIGRYGTPYKYGKPVWTGTGKAGDYNSQAVDCPFVFFHNGRFHMLHVGFDGTGYQTGLAVSDNLLDWQQEGIVLKREENAGWDRVGAAGNWILKETDDLWSVPILRKVDGKYWMAYHSYPEPGYEEGAAEIGLAWCEDENLLEWHRLKEPVFSWKQGGEWDRGGLYKPCLLFHDDRYYLFYNAKNNTSGDWKEQTGVAVSEDMLRWERYAGNPLIKVSPEGGWDSKFCSDPCIARDGDKWVMYYFGYDGRHAQDGIALSVDLFSWVKHPEPILPSGSPGEIDENHAHKASVVYHEGILYHFYCASRKYGDGDPSINMGNEFRCITVATSKKL